MSESATYRVEIPKEHREVWLPSPDGTGTSCHKVLAVTSYNDESPDGEMQVWGEYMLVQCQGTKKLSFCHQSGDSEAFDLDPRTGHQFPAVQTVVYPSRIAGRPEMQRAYRLPHGIYQIYQETYSSISSSLRILAGIGIRAIVEAVCNDQRATGHSLEKKIDDLVAKGLTTADGAEILHGLRFMGNDAAHEIAAHTQNELNVAFDVVENLLQSVYILPTLASRLKKRPKKAAVAKGKKSKKGK